MKNDYCKINNIPLIRINYTQLTKLTIDDLLIKGDWYNGNKFFWLSCTYLLLLASNLRLIDCINQPKSLIDKAIKKGLSGCSITDHESLSSHIIVNKYAKEIKEKYPDFTIALGNEIYLTDTRDKGQKYYHFILLAKDRLGYKALCELSSIAWYNVYVDRRLERVPTLKSELQKVMSKYKGHIVASTACISGELSYNLYGLALARKAGDKEKELEYYTNATQFVQFCIDTFGKDDFYIECAPSLKSD